MKKPAVVIQGVFAAASFGAALGFCWLWRSSVREAERSRSHLTVTSAQLHNTIAMVDKLQDEKRALARKLENKTWENKELADQNKEIR